MKDYTHIVQKLKDKYPTAGTIKIGEIFEYYERKDKIFHNFSIEVILFKPETTWIICEEFATEPELENYIKTLEL